jgi:hypothetical protein
LKRFKSFTAKSSTNDCEYPAASSLTVPPGRHVDGGSLAEILVVRSATGQLRLQG